MLLTSFLLCIACLSCELFSCLYAAGMLLVPANMFWMCVVFFLFRLYLSSMLRVTVWTLLVCFWCASGMLFFLSLCWMPLMCFGMV